MTNTNQRKQEGSSNRGFASMDPDRQRAISAEGGRAAHEKGTAHQFSSEEARAAGAKSHQNTSGRSRSEGQAQDPRTDAASNDRGSSADRNDSRR